VVVVFAISNQARNSSAAETLAAAAGVLQTFCFDCHSDQQAEAKVNL